MENVIDEYRCGLADDIVSYIYNEVEQVERKEFETHLAGCMSCTDEFAAVADARFSIFEWHKEEFSKLPTPVFTIPYVEQTVRSAGLFSTLAVTVRGFGWAIPAAAIVVICVGLTAYFALVGDSGEEVALTSTSRPAIAAISISTDERSKDVVSSSIEIDRAERDQKEPPSSERGKSRAPTVRSFKRVSAKGRVPRTSKTNLRTADKPVLSNYKDIEDKSLRLSDLLDEVGG